MAEDKLRILSYNIHKGFSFYNRKFVLSHIKDSIELVKADVVFLQEVLGQHDEHAMRIKDWPTTSQFEFLAEKVWPHYAYGKNAVYSSGHHGNSILSRYPFSFWENIDISTNRFENRGILHGVIRMPHFDRPVHAICIHLALLESWRRVQIKKLCDRIESHVPHDAPLIVAGDFNDWRERVTEELQNILDLKEVFLAHTGSHKRTYPSWLPVLKLDRIYSRGFEVAQAQCFTKSPWNALSDHAALYAELRVCEFDLSAAKSV